VVAEVAAESRWPEYAELMVNLPDLLGVTFRQIWRNRRSYLLVVLPISLGVAGLIVVFTMSWEVKKTINNDLTLIGRANIIKMYFENQPNQRSQWFRESTVEALRRIPDVHYVSVAARGKAQLLVKNHEYPVKVIAVDDSFWYLNNFSPLKGKLFSTEEVTNRERKAVIGPILAANIFGTQEVINASIGIDRDIYRIIGVLSDLAPITYQEAIFLPLTSGQDRIFWLSPPDSLYIRTKTWDDVTGVLKAATALIKKQQPTEGMVVEVHWETLRRVQNMSWYIEFMVYLAIGTTISLGGAAIWNVMMAAVRVRTREIGLKKAMGAEDKDILIEFLSEAISVSLGAAILGIILGRLVMQVLIFGIGIRSSTNIFFLCVGAGFLLALTLGIGAGLYPALKASRMEVVEAVRYE
jgi:putative ABC transport system permease protein